MALRCALLVLGREAFICERSWAFIRLPRAVTNPLSLFAKTDAVLRQRANLQMALKLRL